MSMTRATRLLNTTTPPTSTPPPKTGPSNSTFFEDECTFYTGTGTGPLLAFARPTSGTLDWGDLAAKNLPPALWGDAKATFRGVSAPSSDANAPTILSAMTASHETTTPTTNDIREITPPHLSQLFEALKNHPLFNIYLNRSSNHPGAIGDLRPFKLTEDTVANWLRPDIRFPDLIKDFSILPLALLESLHDALLEFREHPAYFRNLLFTESSLWAWKHESGPLEIAQNKATLDRMRCEVERCLLLNMIESRIKSEDVSNDSKSVLNFLQASLRRWSPDFFAAGNLYAEWLQADSERIQLLRKRFPTLEFDNRRYRQESPFEALKILVNANFEKYGENHFIYRMVHDGIERAPRYMPRNLLATNDFHTFRPGFSCNFVSYTTKRLVTDNPSLATFYVTLNPRDDRVYITVGPPLKERTEHWHNPRSELNTHALNQDPL